MDANMIDIKIKLAEQTQQSEGCEPEAIMGMGKSSEMSGYCKRTTLQNLQQHGMNLEKIFNRSKCSQEDIKNLIATKAKNSQENVHYECNSQTFLAIDAWLEKFKENQINLSSNELGLIMKIIAECEEHADPAETEGVNFKDLYSFLAKVMNGEPTMELDQTTKEFLWECFQELANDVNSPNGDKDLAKLKTTLILNQFQSNSTKQTLDPLKIRFQ